MDLSAIIVALVLVAIFLATVVGLEIYSRKTQQKKEPAYKAGHEAKTNITPRSLSEK